MNGGYSGEISDSVAASAAAAAADVESLLVDVAAAADEDAASAVLVRTPPAIKRTTAKTKKKNGGYDLLLASSEEEFAVVADDDAGDGGEIDIGDGHDDSLPLTTTVADENYDGRERQLLEEEEYDDGRRRRLRRILYRQLVPDDCYEIRGVRIVDGEAAVKFWKFLAVTCASIAVVHYAVRRLQLEHKSVRFQDMVLYEGHSILMDVLSFYVIGRMYKPNCRGCDHLAWIGWMALANVYIAYGNTWKFLQHSFTLYEMHCRWPWQLWIFVALMVPLIVTLILMYVHTAVQRKVFVMKLLELIMATALFLLPPLFSKYFHFHHWFAGWLVGMHCNFHDKWWSRAAMAWSWGIYVNGVATYGRDPVLTCGYAYYLAKDALRCPFVECYLWAEEHKNETDDHSKEMVAPDWRNCSADSYHP